jgi:RNA polymerase sigma-70 factor (ECF subfamily)
VVATADTRTDGELVELTLGGDTAAFATLYRANVRAVSRLVRDNVANPEVAAELVQEVFARALERLASLREPDRFRPWLLAIARHAVIDQHRYRGRNPVDSLDDERVQEPAQRGPSTEEVAELTELAELVAGCVAGLSRRDATAIALVTHLGFAPADVAAALGVTPGTAKVIVHRARRRLRDALALELMVRRRGPTCPQFSSIDPCQVVALGRHLRVCPACADQVVAEISLYGSEPEPLDAHPAPL